MAASSSKSKDKGFIDDEAVVGRSDSPLLQAAVLGPLSSASTSSYRTRNGTRKVDTLIGGLGNQKIRGKESNDILWGDETDGLHGGTDIFIFESTHARNGTDTIKDYHWSEDGTDGLGQDVLDLTAALKAFKAARRLDPNADIADYVWLEDTTGGVNLMVDVDGPGSQTAQSWALLEGLTTADEVRVRAYTASSSGSGSSADAGEGYFTLGGASADPYLSLDRTGVWFDTNQDGVRDNGEQSATLSGPTNGFYTVDGIDMAAQNVTLRIVDLKVATPLDLTGFGTGDKFVFDARTTKSDWYGFSASQLFNPDPSAPKTANMNTFGSNSANFRKFNSHSYNFVTTWKCRDVGQARVYVAQQAYGYTYQGAVWGGRGTYYTGRSFTKFPGRPGPIATQGGVYTGKSGYFSYKMAINIGTGWQSEIISPV